MAESIIKFNLWSNLEPKSQTELSPSFNLRKIDDLTPEEKNKLWRYLKRFFYKSMSEYFDYGQDVKIKDLVLHSVMELNEKYKYRSYGKELLQSTEDGRTFFWRQKEISREYIFIIQTM